MVTESATGQPKFGRDKRPIMNARAAVHSSHSRGAVTRRRSNLTHLLCWSWSGPGWGGIFNMQTQGHKKSLDSSRFRQEQWVKPGVVALNSPIYKNLTSQNWNLSLQHDILAEGSPRQVETFTHRPLEPDENQGKMEQRRPWSVGNRPMIEKLYFVLFQIYLHPYLFWLSGSRFSFTNSSWFHPAYGFVGKKKIFTFTIFLLVLFLQ